MTYINFKSTFLLYQDMFRNNPLMDNQRMARIREILSEYLKMGDFRKLVFICKFFSLSW